MKSFRNVRHYFSINRAMHSLSDDNIYTDIYLFLNTASSRLSTQIHLKTKSVRDSTIHRTVIITSSSFGIGIPSSEKGKKMRNGNSIKVLQKKHVRVLVRVFVSDHITSTVLLACVC